MAFAIAWTHGLAPEFVYDAAQYWGGAVALVAGDGPVAPGGLATRGVFTAFVYLPPALLTGVLGPGVAAWAVLAWNAALAAAVSVLLLPRLAQLFTSEPAQPPVISRVWVSTLLGSFVLSGFARFPLVDVWSTSLALAGFYGLAVGKRWWTLSLAGFALVVATNLRPSLLAPVLLAVLILAILRWRSVAIALPAACLALCAQLALNVREWGLWSLTPPETGPLMAVQARWGAYALRYDTVTVDGHAPQQWYCDPAYAKLLLGDATPQNQLGVVSSAFQHMPDSIWFLFRKAAASLHWSLATPYEYPPDNTWSWMAVLVLAIAAVGLVSLVTHTWRVRQDRMALVTSLGMLGFWFGALGALVVSTPETRFALPLVLVGLIGLVAAVPARVRLVAPSKAQILGAAVSLLLFLALFVAGAEALGHNLPAGGLADVAACAER